VFSHHARVFVGCKAASRSSNCQLFRSIYDGRAIAINLKTRLFSICISSAAAARWYARVDGAISFTCLRAHLQPTDRRPGPGPGPPSQTGPRPAVHIHTRRPPASPPTPCSGFVSRPVRLWFNKIRRYCSYCTSNLISARHFALSVRPYVSRSALPIRSFFD